MTKKRNSKKEAFFKKLPKNLIENYLQNFENKINFNFSFFDKTQGQDFKDWTEKQLSELLDKLKSYSKENLEHWKRLPKGRKSKVLAVYGTFPRKSMFKHPKYIPLDIDWARFRLEGDSRLIGFIINNDDCNKHNICKYTFYVVFLDENHDFYKK